MIRQAVILSAGLGSRLRPFTDRAPKPMLPLQGVPLIAWNIRRFQQFGVESFFINLHYLPDVIPSYLGDGSTMGVRIQYHYEPELLGTAGGVKSFEEDLDDEFYTIYGDIFSYIDYGVMEGYWRTKREAIGLQTMARTEKYADADIAQLNADGRVTAVHPKPHLTSYSAAHRLRGIFILRREILAQIPSGAYSEIGRDLMPTVLARGEAFYGYETGDFSKGIDTVEKWREVEAYLAANHITISAPLTEHGRANRAAIL